MPTRNIYSVAQINSYIRNMFALDYMLGLVYVRGEISNLKYHASGHIYFSLKDAGSVISCVMFAGNRRGLNFTLEEGMQVIARGKIEVFERDGKYQLYANQIQQEGMGQQNEQLEALKAKLAEMGMFAEEYKQPIPYYIHRLGVVTSGTGAAVQDIISVSLRRNPYLQIIVYPVLVQGPNAPADIAGGIKALEHYGVDTIIIGRGGGSSEDLSAFNTEIVAQAIFDCMIPIISAVGHEIDYSIADLVADVRVPTPSAAAEIAVQKIDDILNRMKQYQNKLENLFQNKFLLKAGQAKQYELRVRALSPENMLNQKRSRSVRAEELLENKMQQILKNRKHELEILITRLQGDSPLTKLQNGFGHVENQNGKAVTDIRQVSAGDVLDVYVQNGQITAEVKKVQEMRFTAE